MLRHEDREQAAETDVAEDGRQRGDDRDHHQQPTGERVGDREAADEGERQEGNDVVEQHEPDAPVAVEERPGDRADQEPGEDACEGHEPGERGRVVAVEREQDEGHADHRLRDAGDLHREEDASERRDAQQRAIGAIEVMGHGTPILSARSG